MRSAPFVPAQAGAFRWIVAYSGDGFHRPAATACGIATSTVAKAAPAIVAAVKRKLTVGDSFQVKALLSGAQAPTGLVTFTVYGPNPSGCGRPLAVDKVKVSASGTTLSDPFTAERPGRYLFVAEYSGDASNQAASQACEAAGAAAVGKRKPRLKPRARRKGRRIVIGARLANAVSPTGKIRFRLYGPGDNSCHRKPAFGGAHEGRRQRLLLARQVLRPRAGDLSPPRHLLRRRAPTSGPPSAASRRSGSASPEPSRSEQRGQRLDAGVDRGGDHEDGEPAGHRLPGGALAEGAAEQDADHGGGGEGGDHPPVDRRRRAGARRGRPPSP